MARLVPLGGVSVDHDRQIAPERARGGERVDEVGDQGARDGARALAPSMEIGGETGAQGHALNEQRGVELDQHR